MVEVEGDYCPYVEQKCLRWLDPATKLQCAEFEKTAVAGRCLMKTEHKRFCIDRYEWPNKVGALPRYMASWNEAKASVREHRQAPLLRHRVDAGLRGPGAAAVPVRRRLRARRAGLQHRQAVHLAARREGLRPADQRRRSSRASTSASPADRAASCVSPYGVHDMTGNVDEWVVNVSQIGKPHESGLKGGYWGPVRTRCRPMTTAHSETFRYYQIGFRCCGSAHEGGTSDEAPLATR